MDIAGAGCNAERRYLGARIPALQRDQTATLMLQRACIREEALQRAVGTAYDGTETALGRVFLDPETNNFDIIQRQLDPRLGQEPGPSFTAVQQYKIKLRFHDRQHHPGQPGTAADVQHILSCDEPAGREAIDDMPFCKLHGRGCGSQVDDATPSKDQSRKFHKAFKRRARRGYSEFIAPGKDTVLDLSNFRHGLSRINLRLK